MWHWEMAYGIWNVAQIKVFWICSKGILGSIILLHLTWFSVWHFSQFLWSINISTESKKQCIFRFRCLCFALFAGVYCTYEYFTYCWDVENFTSSKGVYCVPLLNIFLTLICSSLQTYKTYRGGVFTLTRLLIPAWIVHYYVKYHVAVSYQKCYNGQQMRRVQNRDLSRVGSVVYLKGDQTLSCAKIFEKWLIFYYWWVHPL